ncbi:MFS transporter [Agromyces atrinae]|uniref:MFS family permease n=1 Tax=Agromyces atrinae TaxID=592376 RepID=A0A4Q2MCC7_9MICO|nr:MFS transporter [Agromyces atrinae]NYD67655.1 MFS family permease [Agromyces atrinae]RXZ88143.1 MFS transporter [Agromyces atrinae]
MSLRARRLSLFALFALPGLTIASWVTRTPAIRDLLGASTAEMGVVLLGLSAGSMLGILLSGPAVTRLGAKPVMITGSLGVILSMPMIGLGAASGSIPTVVIGLFLFGLGMGGGEVATNVEGADIERLSKRPVLPQLHGSFSLGTFIGASAGILFTALAVPVEWHLVVVGIIALGVLAAAAPRIISSTGRAPLSGRQDNARPATPVWKDSRLILIALLVLVMALIEGTASDWLPLVMVDGHGVTATLGSAVYAAFAAAMTIGRFAGGAAVARFGRAPVLRIGIISAAAGMALVVFVDNQIVAALGVILWGLGASLGFPLALSAAGEGSGESARRVAFAATIGYAALLVGPPLIGFIGEHSSLRIALIVPLLLVVGAIFLAPVVRPSNGTTEPSEMDQYPPTLLDASSSTRASAPSAVAGARR